MGRQRDNNQERGSHEKRAQSAFGEKFEINIIVINLLRNF